MKSVPHRQKPAEGEIARHVPRGLELGLRNYWYPVMQAADLPHDKPVGFKALDEQLVAWRDKAGHPRVVRDKCPHRGAKLSPGRVLNGDLQCSWHGLRFNGEGRCTLIPWEPEDSPLLRRVGINGYPAEELAGWIWAYIGDTQKFPAPPLAEVVPEEFTKPDEFMIFWHPVEIWHHNWLMALDGNDAFHAVMLHSDSQPVAHDAAGEGPPKRPPIPLEDRRMQIVDSPQGLRGIVLDPEDRQIHHGHFMHGWKGERWTLPGLFSIPIQPRPSVKPYVARVYQFAVDATHTQSSRWASMRATTDEERAHCTRLWNEVVRPRQIQVMREDQQILESLGDLAESRSEEFLFNVDRDVVAVRRMFVDAWHAQAAGTRPMPSREAFVFPV